jgi:glutamate synthase domain-containing protein 1
MAWMSASPGPFGPGFLGTSSMRTGGVLATHQRLMKRQQRRGPQGDGDRSDTCWTEEERPQSAQQSIAQRQVRRPSASAAQDDQLPLEQEILRDHRSHAAGPHSFAVITARSSRASRRFFMRESASVRRRALRNVAQSWIRRENCQFETDRFWRTSRSAHERNITRTNFGDREATGVP